MKTWRKALLVIAVLLVLGLVATSTFKVASASGGQPSVVMVDTNSDGKPDYQIAIGAIVQSAKLNDGTMGLWVTGEVSQISPLP